MDRRSRACMLLHTRYVHGLWSKLARLWAPETRPSTKTCRGKNANRAQWTVCLVSSSHRQKDTPCQWGEKRMKMERPSGATARGRYLEFGASRTWSLGHKNWALTRSLPTSRFVPASCHDRVLASAQYNKGAVQMQMRERDGGRSK